MSTSNDGVARCGAATRSGAPCRNRVARDGERCRVHQGLPAVADSAPDSPPASAPPRRRAPGRVGKAPRRPATTPRKNTGPRRMTPPVEAPSPATAPPPFPPGRPGARPPFTRPTAGSAPKTPPPPRGARPRKATPPAEPPATEPPATEPSPTEPPAAILDADPTAAAPAPGSAASESAGGRAPDGGAPPAGAAGSEEPEVRDPRLDRAAARCASAVANGAMDAVDALAVPYLGEAGWSQLRDSWRRENCVLLAKVARQALESPAKLHDAAGKLAAQVWIWLGRPWLEQMMVREVVKRLPILGEGQVRPVARAVQLAGIRLCHAHDSDLTHCPCFADLVEHEGERRPKQLLDAAPKGWDGLARLR